MWPPLWSILVHSAPRTPFPGLNVCMYETFIFIKKHRAAEIFMTVIDFLFQWRRNYAKN